MNDLISRMVNNPGWKQSVERLTAIYHALSAVCAYGVPGDVCEIGCNEGETSVLIQSVLKYCNADKALHLYDSFEGMSDHTAEDTMDGYGYSCIQKGELKAHPSAVLARFRERCLTTPQIHPGWVADTLPGKLPDQIAFALLDTDLYEPILQSLEHVYPRLAPGAFVVVDDYGWLLTPGVKLALDQFLSDKPEKVQLLTEAVGQSKSGSAGFRKGEA